MKHTDPSTLLQEMIDHYPEVFAVIHEAVLLGWEAAIRDMASLQHAPGPLRLRTRRNVENDYVVHYARQFLEPFESAGMLSWVDEADTATLRLDHNYAVRVKKVNRDGRSSNIRTGRQSHIAKVGQLMLFGIIEEDLHCDDQVWLTVGYVPDSLDETIEIVGLTIGDGRFGMHAIDRADDAVLVQLAPASRLLIEEARRQLSA